MTHALVEQLIAIKLDESEKDGANGYVAFYKGKRLEVYADSSYDAQKKAATLFKAKKSYDVTVVLAEKGDKQVSHTADF